jgi:hypothetical protein
MSPKTKTVLLAAAAAAAFVAASLVAVQSSRAEAFIGDRFDYRVDTRYDADGNRITPAVGKGEFRPGERLGVRPEFGRDVRPDRFHWPRPRVTANGSASGHMPHHVKHWRARQAAIAAWQRKVAFRYGDDFARWYTARDRHVQCDAGLGSVYCEVSAVPARGWRHWGQVRE